MMKAQKKKELNAFGYFDSLDASQKILVTYDINEQYEDVEVISCDNFILLK